MSWKDLFHFTKNEQKGLVVLGGLIIITAFAPDVWVFLFPPENPNPVELEREYQAWLASPIKQSTPASFHPSPDTTWKSHDTVFWFDPNELPAEGWKKLGLSQKQAEVIGRYLAGGRRFEVVEDLKRIRVISPAFFERIRDHVRISSGTGPPKPGAASFPFDPNTILTSEMARLGLPDHVCQAIEHYRQKGGRFRKPSDLARIYGLSDSLLKRLEPWVRLADTPAAGSRAMRETAPATILELNTTDSLELQAIHGIGPVTARRIIRYRDRLGGFVDFGQLLEIKDIEQDFLARVKPFLRIDGTKIKKLNPNFAGAAEMAVHPYLGWDFAKALVKHRNRNGPFTTPDQLAGEGLIPSDRLRQLRPYLELEE